MAEMVEKEEKKWAVSWGGYMEELKKGSRIAAPMVAVALLQYLLQVVSVIMVGHLGQLSLSSVAIATSLTNVTGFSLLLITNFGLAKQSGVAGGLETLCGQAFGSKQYKKLGVYTYTAVISLILICPPICILWIFMDKLLPLVGQDTLISHKARQYSLWLIPGLFASAILKPLTRFLQMQSVTLPMLLSAFLVLCFHAPVCWILVYKLDFGDIGAAIAFSLSTWLNVILLGIYVKYSSACEKTRSPLSKDAFLGVPEFFRLGVPSAVMVCLKWWAMELLTLLSGLLPNAKLETSVLSICLTISTLHFTIPYGFGAAASTRVSNELGAGNPEIARMAVKVGMSMATIEAIIVSIALFFSRHIVGYAYSNEKPVVKYVAAMAPLLCISLVTDSIQVVLSGVAKGCGWQSLGAYANLGAFYLIGLPIGIVLGFVAHLKGRGLWIGIVAGSIVQTILLSLFAIFTNWEKQVAKAKERVSTRNSSSQN
ncbi:Multi antimicrobial extrusion protein [Corchorus olitorius]|uniref:Protein DETOXIFICATION n=1 Tax=Corchorus olitorius TaxID=93759 RepID=A0A1R3KC85_9ROSI|nr:Multi antimicrobial extrusion protein [Corchorus olitorius]